MNVKEMRAYISDAYPGKSWKARCAFMKEQQVVAIYHSLVNRDKEKKELRPKKARKGKDYQMTIYDFLDK